MSNQITGSTPGSAGSPGDSIGKLVHLQVELLDTSMKTASGIIGPLGKASVDLAGSIISLVNQVLAAVSTAIAPKKS